MFTYQYTYVQGSKGLNNQSSISGVFLTTEEGQFLVEEDNASNFLTSEE